MLGPGADNIALAADTVIPKEIDKTTAGLNLGKTTVDMKEKAAHAVICGEDAEVGDHNPVKTDRWIKAAIYHNERA